MIQARNSAPPDPSPSSSPSRYRGQTNRAGFGFGDDVAHSSSAVASGSLYTNRVKQEMDEARRDAAADTDSAVNELLAPALNGNGRIYSIRQTRSSSPVSKSGGSSFANANGLVDSAIDDVDSENDQAADTALSAEERRQLRVQASAKSATVLPPPPSLPYDLTYAPLSPMGVDQVGRSLASLYPLQAAQIAAVQEQGRKRSKTAGGDFAVAPASTMALGSHLATAATAVNGRHAANEKPKKPLAGQELERHLVSQAPGQRPLPWGLQRTLIDRAQNDPRGRTRMGSLKRNAPHEVRMRNDKSGPRSDASTSSEHGSPQLQSSHVHSASRLANGAAQQYEPDTAPPEERLASEDRSEQSTLETEAIPSSVNEINGDQSTAMTSQMDEDEAKESTEAVETAEPLNDPIEVANGENGENATAGQDVAAPLQSVPEARPAASQKRPRGRGSRLETERLGLGGDLSQSELQDDTAGDTSLESISGSRRPRAAHKRLKVMGGYYGRNLKQNEESDAAVEDVKKDDGDVTLVIEAQNDDVDEIFHTAASRAPSSLPEEAGGASALLDEDGIAVEDHIEIQPTTPIKASQQPSLSLGLRNSASKSQAAKMMHAGARPADASEGNNEYCETCNGAGHFICCDGCPRSFHFACINPPLDIDELPKSIGDADDKWFCNVCKSQEDSFKGAAASATSSLVKGKKQKRMFAPLLSYIERNNPTTFALPQDIRNYFKGVATATDGSYVDSTMLRPLKIGKTGLIDERDPFRLKDKNGKLVLCYRCGQSALPAPSTATAASAKDEEGKGTEKGARRNTPRKSARLSNGNQETLSSAVSEHSVSTNAAADADDKRTGWRRVIGCDFCSLYWHLDCLDPPLATMPSPSRKWMCPNHTEHVTRPERVPKSTANSLSIHDLPLPSLKTIGPGKHYRTRVVNNGQIDIIPDPMDTYFDNASSSASTRVDVHAPSSSLSSTITGSNGDRGKGLEKGWEEQDIPANVLSTSYRHSAGGSGTANFKFKYRLPEKVIRLDFWQRAEMEREQSLARLMRKIGRQSHLRIDALASVANAALMAATSDSHDRTDKLSKAQVSEGEAKLLVEEVFGSQTARTLYPSVSVKKHDDKDDDDAQSVNVKGALDSAIRQTYVAGEYEDEFDVRSQANISESHAAVVRALSRTNGEVELQVQSKEQQTAVAAERRRAIANQLGDGIDVEEVEQLRAIKALVDHRGAKAMLQFLLNQEGGQD